MSVGERAGRCWLLPSGPKRAAVVVCDDGGACSRRESSQSGSVSRPTDQYSVHTTPPLGTMPAKGASFGIRAARARASARNSGYPRGPSAPHQFCFHAREERGGGAP
jgi:hypothetical protein